MDSTRLCGWKRGKGQKILTTLHGWVQAGNHDQGVLFQEFESVVGKLRHVFTALPGGHGLLSVTHDIHNFDYA